MLIAYAAPFGSVSSATMRPEDLIPTFIDELSHHLEQRSLHDSPLYGDAETQQAAVQEFQRVTGILADIESRMYRSEGDGSTVRADYWESEDAQYDLETLFDELSQFAPSYGYFGANEGDGADYGYWLGDLDDCDALRVDDLSEVPDDYTGEVLHVNDHGNCTLYAVDAGELTEVWAVV